ncbi:MAG: twin transmembrane helix small protein [Proteobacteria bacterium]|nr:twin transmembrane helix small protein [Pseudomonadota bacterium]
MDNHWIIKLIIIAFMVSIVFSLGSGLYYILYRREKKEQAVKALTLRVSLSIFLFLILLGAFAMGWIKPHHLYPIANTQTQIKITKPHPQSANTTPPLRNQSGVQE